VDRIERGDEVEGLGLRGPVEVAQIDRDELDVVAPGLRGILAGAGDRLRTVKASL
jgi:hypothetical protein